MGPRMRPRSITIRMKIAQFHGGGVSVIKGKFGGTGWPSLTSQSPNKRPKLKNLEKEDTSYESKMGKSAHRMVPYTHRLQIHCLCNCLNKFQTQEESQEYSRKDA